MGLQNMYEDPVGLAATDPDLFALVWRICKGAAE
jgi:hypothetical protein